VTDYTYCPWMKVAEHLVGTREVPGPRHSSAILRMWESIKVSFRDDETPWCAGFVGHCLETAGVPSTRSAAARSYLKWGTSYPDTGMCLGAVVVLSRPGSAWSGHVGFLAGRHPKKGLVYVLGGNQGDTVCYAAFPTARVIDYRWPDGECWYGHGYAEMPRCPVYSVPQSFKLSGSEA
jgi:uncharacterized protein (TIGR02594 family)